MSLYLDNKSKRYTSLDEVHQCITKWSEEFKFNPNCNYIIQYQKDERTNELAIRLIRGFAFSTIILKNATAEQICDEPPAETSRKYYLNISGTDPLGKKFTFSAYSFYNGHLNYHQSAISSSEGIIVPHKLAIF